MLSSMKYRKPHDTIEKHDKKKKKKKQSKITKHKNSPNTTKNIIPQINPHHLPPFYLNVTGL